MTCSARNRIRARSCFDTVAPSIGDAIAIGPDRRRLENLLFRRRDSAHRGDRTSRTRASPSSPSGRSISSITFALTKRRPFMSVIGDVFASESGDRAHLHLRAWIHLNHVQPINIPIRINFDGHSNGVGVFERCRANGRCAHEGWTMRATYISSSRRNRA